MQMHGKSYNNIQTTRSPVSFKNPYYIYYALPYTCATEPTRRDDDRMHRTTTGYSTAERHKYYIVRILLYYLCIILLCTVFAE